jgi:uncharacterized protein (TIGR00295 family)
MDEKQAIALLKKQSKDPKVFNMILSHVKLVERIALKIAKKIQKNKHPVDIELVKVGSLLHDIGRFSCPPKTSTGIRHGIVGSAILRKEAKGERNKEKKAILLKCALVCDRHIGVGIKKSDIIKQGLNLPLRDFVPKTLEENIISYADNLAEGKKVMDINYVIERFRKEVGEYIVPRVMKQHEFLSKLMGE